MICTHLTLFTLVLTSRRVQISNTGLVDINLLLRLYLRNRIPAVFLSSISISLLAFYHECCSLIGYATHVLFGDRW